MLDLNHLSCFRFDSLYCTHSDDFYLHVSCYQVIAESLSEEEIAGLKEMFKAMDTDNSGAITFDELKAGLRRYGSTLKDIEIRDLMDAVRFSCQSVISTCLVVFVHFCTSPLHCFFPVTSPFLHFHTLVFSS